MYLAIRSLSTVLLKAVLVAAMVVAFCISVAPSAYSATRSCSSSTPTTQRPLLKYGDLGSCVKVAQRQLQSRGFSVGSAGADGDFGPSTRSAVIKFQRSKGLTADGIIGQQTWRALAGGTVSNPTPPPVSTSYNQSRGPNYTSRVVLTYDDCPKSLSQMKSVVRSAASSNVGLVMFPTGNCLKSGKFDANYARSYGHYVANHSVSHPDLTTLSYSSVRLQLRSPGVVTNYGRPPYGAINGTVRSAYSAEGMRIWTWNVDTRDWTGKSSSSVVSSALQANRGDTVLMHMGWNAFNATAIRQIKSGLANRGISVCRPYSGTAPRNLPNSLPC